MDKIKLILTAALLLILNCANATIYYFSNSLGDDTRTPAQARNSATPWKTLAKASSYSASMLAGDSLLFKCGDTFYGNLVMGRSGGLTTKMYIGKYGSGAKPIFSGWSTATSWTSFGGGIYYTNVGSKWNLRAVSFNGNLVGMGRYPNADSANHGFLVYEAITTSTLTDNQLTGVPDWTGAHAMITKNSYRKESDTITSQSTTTINYLALCYQNPSATCSGSLGGGSVSAPRGWFIQDDIRTLNQLGEWYASKLPDQRLYMYFGGATPSSFTVKISTVDTLINLNAKTNIIIDGISFTGCSRAAIYGNNTSFIYIYNCDIDQSGNSAIWLWNSGFSDIMNNTINHCLVNGIFIGNNHTGHNNVVGNSVKNTATIIGMEATNDDKDGQAIAVNVDSFAVISRSIVDTVSYIGIQFNGNVVNVDTNQVNYALFYKNDGGGIYTFGNKTGYSRNIRNNFITNIYGSDWGMGNGSVSTYGNGGEHAEGIYSDGASAGEFISYNSLYNVHGRTIYLNDPKRVTVWNNTAYGGAGWGVNKHTSDSIFYLRVGHNIFVNDTIRTFLSNNHYNENIASTWPPLASNIQQSVQRFTNGGYMDTNYYRLSTSGLWWFYANTLGGANVFPAHQNFAAWQAYSGHDSHSTDLGPSTLMANIRYEGNPSDTIRQVNFTGSIYRRMDGTLDTNAVNIQRWQSWVGVFVGAVNNVPTVSAGGNKSITLPITAVPVTGSASDDGGSVTVAWSQLFGPTTATFTASTNVNTTINNLTSAGSYGFKLTATGTGGSGDVNSDNMTVTVNPNTPPIISPSPVAAQTITAPTASVTATVSATDPGGAIASYRWYYLSGPSGSVITNGTTSTVTISSLVPGSYSYGVTVKDNSNDSSTTTFSVTVNPAVTPPNTPPVFSPNPVAAQTKTLPTATTTATAAATDDVAVTGYRWYYISGPSGLTISNSAIATPTFGWTLAGVYNLRVIAYDATDSTATTWQLTVNPAVNTPPVFSPNPIAAQTKVLPTVSTTATAAATDDVAVLSYQWYYSSGPSGLTISNANIATPTFGWTNTGVYTLRVVARDATDSTSTTWQLTVNPAPTTPPIPDAGPDASFYLPTTAVTLGGSGTDGLNCPILTHTWTLISNPVGSFPIITTPGSYTSTFTNLLVAGTYTLRLTLTSACSIPVYDDIIINVLPVIVPPSGCNCFPTFTKFEN